MTPSQQFLPVGQGEKKECRADGGRGCRSEISGGSGGRKQLYSFCPQLRVQSAATAFDEDLPLPAGPVLGPAYCPGGPLDLALLFVSAKVHCGRAEQEP
mmetsp:Transcript_116906/g.232998  ORF Transcript_116906/g.232998 Transcript_116906/m.232998 type:complete len:99 (+) Transcript_116906:143-439(+)